MAVAVSKIDVPVEGDAEASSTLLGGRGSMGEQDVRINPLRQFPKQRGIVLHGM